MGALRTGIGEGLVWRYVITNRHPPAMSAGWCCIGSAATRNTCCPLRRCLHTERGTGSGFGSMPPPTASAFGLSQTQPSRAPNHRCPSVDLPALVPGELVGQRFFPTDRDPIADLPGTIFYFDTYELLEPTVHVVGQAGHVFEVRISGACTDVNYYDGSKQRTRVELNGRFTFTKMSEWEQGR